MSKGLIVGMGGGASLNYKVVGGTTQPTSASENTIWVNTSTEISSHIFSTTEPTNPVEGMVWFKTGATSVAPFNALKKNGITVYPLGCKQYVNGAWESKTAKTYYGNKWVDWTFYLFDIAAANDTSAFEFTPHSNGALNPVLTYHQGQYVSIKNPSSSATTTYLKEDPDFTGFSKLILKGYCSLKGEKMVIAEAGQRKTFDASSIASVTLDVTDGEYVIDISELTGKYAVGFNFRAASNRYIYVREVILE